MDKATMVSVEVSQGTEILEALDQAGVKVSVALWACLAEFGDWRLVISSRQFDTADPRHAYRLLRDSLAKADHPLKNTPPILILPTNDKFIRELRRIFGKTKSVDGMRLGGQMIGDRFVEDAYVYRVS
ncbi:MAG: hypothetical protein K2X03_20470 [Bryobacteraceae bacterium]|nr:hypothetical protein [Bryobacteraceae bacterium]